MATETKKSAAPKKAASKKAAAKKAPAKKSAAVKRTATKKSAIKKAVSKPATKKSATKKSATKKSTAKKSTAKKSTAKKSASKKSTAAKKSGTNKLGVKNSLVNNINAKKKKGTSHSKSDSTVDKESYDKMEDNWGKDKQWMMAKFKIEKATAQGKTWKATGENPETGRDMTIQGGQKGTPVGSKNPDSERSFDARHDATGMTPKKYVNKLRWDDKADMGDTVNIPDKLFKKKK